MKNIFLLCLMIGLTACGAGSGEGLDNQGRPIDLNNGENPDTGNNNDNTDNGEDNSTNNGALLTQIQNEIFSPICSVCHAGSNAPRGLRLDSENNSFSFLVGVNSDEVPDLLRVEPGDPDNSYIVRKIEGAPGIVGSQMPLGQTPLSPEKIALIRQWIEGGAQQTPAENAAANATKIQFVGIEKIKTSEIAFTFYFDSKIDAESVNQNNVLVYQKEADTEYLLEQNQYQLSTSHDELRVQIQPQTLSTSDLIIKINTPGLPGIRNTAGDEIDGNNNHVAGGKFTYVYSSK